MTDTTPRPSKQKINPLLLTRIVCFPLDFKYNTLCSGGKAGDRSFARAVLAYIYVRREGISYPGAAQLVGFSSGGSVGSALAAITSGRYDEKARELCRMTVNKKCKDAIGYCDQIYARCIEESSRLPKCRRPENAKTFDKVRD